MKKIVISGYYGFSNAGDEAVLYAILRALKNTAQEDELELVVLSGNPSQTSEEYSVKAINRWNPVEVLQNLRNTDLFISGGGSLIQDVTGRLSSRYYLWVLSMARVLSKKVMVYAQGVGPLNSRSLRRTTQRIFDSCDLITVRDVESREDLLRMGVAKDIHVMSDPVMALRKNIVPSEPGDSYLQDLGLKDLRGGKTKPLLGAFLRGQKNRSYCRVLAQALDQKVRDGWNVLMIPMQHEQDLEIAVEIGNYMQETLYYLGKPLTPREILSITGQLDLVLGMRLHSLIFAAVMGIPMIAISYDPKVERFVSQFGMVSCLHLDHLDLDKINDAFRWVEAHWREQLDSTQRRAQLMYRQAWETAGMASSLL